MSFNDLERIDVIGSNGNNGEHYMVDEHKRVAYTFVNKYLNEGKYAATKWLQDIGVEEDTAKELSPYIEEEFNRRGFYFPND